MKLGIKVGFLFGILVTLFTTSSFAQGIPSMPIGHTSSLEPVEIRLVGKYGEATLRVPKAYLVKVKNWLGGEQENVYIEAILPDMRPVRAEDLERSKSLSPIVHVWLSGYAGDKGDHYVLSQVKELSPYCVATKYKLCELSDSYFQATKKIPGKVPAMGLLPGYVHYFGTKGERYIIIKCEKNRIYCKNRTNIVPRISGFYDFDSQMVPEKWDEVDEKVNQLVAGFVVSEGKLK